MPASHRKFGDLLEEGIKRVHITRKKPIGYILDEFGYELRPDDSSKGRHALGHWYYKKRIPASKGDVAKLAELIVTNSDVERGWLSAFLDSADYPDTDKFCDRFFLPKTSVEPDTVSPERPLAGMDPSGRSEIENQTIKEKKSWRWYVLGSVVVGIAAVLFLIQRQHGLPAVDTVLPATRIEPSILPTSTEIQATAMTSVVESPTIPPVTFTPEILFFDGRCPEVVSTSAFEYLNPQSFREFLNDGGSFVALQSGFNVLVQNKADLLDGRVASIDLTGDEIPEIIVNAVFSNGSVWQILGCTSGLYQPLVDINDPEGLYLRFAVDLNGNKLPEIIGYRQTQLESNRFYEFFIQEWNGDRFVDLVDNARFEDISKRLPADITDWQRLVSSATMTTRDTNGDGLFEMVVTGGLITPVPTCETRFERQFTETWAWNGKSYQLSDRVYDPPRYRFQRSADGDLAFALKQFDRALEAYREVVFDADLFRRNQYLSHLEFCSGVGPAIDNALIENEEEQLTAYARWRILLINTLNGSEDAMLVVYQTLQEKFPEGRPGHSYAVIASSFWEEYQNSKDAQAACEAANLTASDQTLYPNHEIENICFVP